MADQTLKVRKREARVDCLLIPLNDRQLLLPNTAVAEVVPFSHLLMSDAEASWVLGRLDWRGSLVPAICYELLSEQVPPEPNPDARFIIVNTITGPSELPFYAILVQGIPRLLHLGDDDLQEVESVMTGPYDKMAVSMPGLNAVIPDLEAIENTLSLVI